MQSGLAKRNDLALLSVALRSLAQEKALTALVKPRKA